MAIYSMNIRNISRGKGSSACASLSYMTAERVLDERTGVMYYGFGRCERVAKVDTILPDGAPEEYKKPSVLINALEKKETAINSRTAKRIIVALPKELDLDTNAKIVEDYIKNNLTKEGYAAIYAIHEDGEGNPHAHILIPNRAIDKKGEWTTKRKMEYALDDKGERIPLIDKATGQQKVDKQNRKQWKRVNVEVNPLDKKEFLQQLRKSWADECNKYLAPELHIDHRSNVDRGIEEEPTIHEGYSARKIESQGGVSERCQVNREIKERRMALQLIKEQLAKIIEQIGQLTKGVIDGIQGLLHRSRVARDTSGVGRNDDTVGNNAIGTGAVGDGETERLIREATVTRSIAEEHRADAEDGATNRRIELGKSELERENLQLEQSRDIRRSVKAERSSSDRTIR